MVEGAVAVNDTDMNVLHQPGSCSSGGFQFETFYRPLFYNGGLWENVPSLHVLFGPQGYKLGPGKSDSKTGWWHCIHLPSNIHVSTKEAVAAD